MTLDLPTQTAPAVLADIVRELAERGVAPTPLNVLARATDIGLGDQELAAIVTALTEMEIA